MWQDDPSAAHAYQTEALPLTRESGDTSALIFALRQMGNLLIDDPEACRPYLEESIEIARKAHNLQSQAGGFNSLGNMYQLQFDYDRAAENYHTTIRIAREVQNPYMETMALANIVGNYIAAEDYATARKEAADVLRTVREIGDRSLEPGILESMAWIEIRDGSEDKARGYLKQVMKLLLDEKTKPLTTMVLYAVLEARAGRKQKALEWIGCLRAAPSLNRSAIEWYLHFHMDEVTEGLSPADVEAALARGASLKWEDVLAEIENPTREVAANT
jgi:tetratricopeptide (TPR) repeat protein